MFLQGHQGDGVLFPWLQPRLVEGGDGAGELGNHTTLIILSGNEISINLPPQTGVFEGMHGEEVPPVFQPSLARPASPNYIVTLAHPTMEMQKPGMKSPTKRGALLLLGCKIRPIPPPSPASVFCHLCLCCSPEEER